MKKQDKTSWGGVAAWYDDLLKDPNSYQSKVILPNLLRILPPRGRVVDIACGQGFFSRAYAEGGAEVLGVDISPELIQKAKENKIKNTEFAVAPAANMKDVPNSFFDSAFIILALQNIKEMGEALMEANRVLKKDGVLVVVLNHPAFRIPKASSWGFDEEKNIQYRRVDQYGVPFTAAIDMAPGKKSNAYTMSFHRPLQEYVKALTKAGFVITGLEEWISHKKSEAGPRARAEDTARKEFPLFLTLVAQKQ